VFAMAALKMGVAMTPRQLIEGRAIMVRALARSSCAAASLALSSGRALCARRGLPSGWRRLWGLCTLRSVLLQACAL
jgi:hypothetical protein